MKRSNFALRLQPALLEELRKIARSEGVALNQLINVAVAEKVSALRTEEFFQERAQRANREEALKFLERAGKGNPPMPGDELPSGLKIGLTPAKLARRAARSVPRKKRQA